MLHECHLQVNGPVAARLPSTPDILERRPRVPHLPQRAIHGQHRSAVPASGISYRDSALLIRQLLNPVRAGLKACGRERNLAPCRIQLMEGSETCGHQWSYRSTTPAATWMAVWSHWRTNGSRPLTRSRWWWSTTDRPTTRGTSSRGTP